MIDGRNQHLERRAGIARWRRDVSHDRFEQRREVRRWDAHVVRRDALTGGRVDEWRIQLRRIGFELEQQLEHFIMDT
jgi:hypothetical protein